MNFYAWTGLINAITTGVVALFVWSRRQHDSRRTTFAYLVASVSVWSLGYFLWQRAMTEQSALLFCRVLAAGCALIPPLLLHHVATLVETAQSSRTRQLIRLSYVIAVFVLLGDATSLVVRSVEPRLSFPFWPVPGPLWHAYTLLFAFDVGYAITLLYHGCVTSVGRARNQLRYLLVGAVVAFAGGATNFFLWYNIPIPPVGNVVVPFYVTLSALAVIRYQFMDIKVAVTRTGMLLATYLVVLGVPFAIGWWGRPGLEARLGREWWLVPLGLCTVLATVGPFVYAYLRRQAEARLLKEQRRYQRTLELAAQGMTRVRSFAKLSKLIVRVVSRTVRVDHASLLVWDKDATRFVLAASDGPKRLAVQSQYGLEPSHPLIRWLLDHRKVFSGDDLDRQRDAAVATELQRLSAELIVPGLIERELIGFLVLGRKRSGEAYSPDDVHAFSTLAHEAAVAIENARSYDELRKVNEQLRIAYERLLRQERLAAAGQIAAGMAHEIKNPLASIKIFAEFLPEKYDDPDFRRKFSRIVQSEVDRINGIVHELLDFAKPAPLKLEPVNIGQLVEETAQLLSNQGLKQGVEIEHRLATNGLLIPADPKQLRQVLLNLALNSLEAMPAGGRLTFATSTIGIGVRIQISDTGCGMSEEARAKIFDPFFTTKERGMGLGLAIVKGVIERHGGQINVSSRPSEGTTMEVSLPTISCNKEV